MSCATPGSRAAGARRSRTRLTGASDGLIRSLPPGARTPDPRKSKPSSRRTVLVVSSLKARPLSASHSASNRRLRRASGAPSDALTAHADAKGAFELAARSHNG